MHKLVVNPESPTAWEIQLKPGTNSLGRGAASDFQINDPSVSGAHCEIILSDSGAVIKDLGSTNGTFINRAPVQEATLQPGQRIRLGGVEMLFESDTPPVAPPIPRAVPVAVAVSQGTPSAAPVKAAPAVRISIAKTQAKSAPAVPVPPPPTVIPTIRVAGSETAAEESADASPDAAPLDVGEVFCKSHIKTPATYYCGHCAHYYCDLCVSTRPT